jgi:serine protease
MLVVVTLVASGASGDHEDPASPNDPLFAEAGDNLGQWGPRQIRTEEAWHTTTGNGTTIAIVDTGVDLDHEDLAAKILPGATFLCDGDPIGGCGNGDWKSGPRDGAADSVHGTHVAGIAAAVTGNGIGIAGVARDAKILPVKVIDENGGSFEDIGAGIRWAADHGADVINLSIGGIILGLLPGSQVFTLLGDETETDAAIAYAQSKGVVVVAAAGNESFALCADPAFASGAICVTATDSHEARPAYSNAALNESTNAVAAPGGGEEDYALFCGGGILSTVPAYTADQQCGYPGNGAYDELYGTSMATPHVAGEAALLAALGCTEPQIVGLITSTARQPGTGIRGMFTPAYGYGIVDAEAAAAGAAAAGCPDAPVASSSPSVSPGASASPSGSPGASSSPSGSPGPSPSGGSLRVNIADGIPAKATPDTDCSFLITLSTPARVPVTVHYETKDGSGVAGTHYAAGSGTITFVPGDTSEEVRIDVLKRAKKNKTFSVVLSNATSGASIGDGSGSCTIKKKKKKSSSDSGRR